MTAPGSTIISVGSGASLLIDELLGDRYHVIALDLSATALETVRSRIGDVTGLDLLEADIRHIDLTSLASGDKHSRFQEPVDAWHDRAVFHFLTTAEDQAAYARSATAVVRSGGHLVIATFAPDGPTECSGLPTQRHDAGSLVAVFEPSFELIESFETDHVTPWGAVQPFTHAVFRRT